jgi:hypothetical protein
MNIVHDSSTNALPVGALGYPYGKPQKAGVIVAVHMPAPALVRTLDAPAGPDNDFMGSPSYTVMQKNGTVYETGNPQLLQNLLDEYDRKARAGRKVLESLQELRTEVGR